VGRDWGLLFNEIDNDDKKERAWEKKKKTIVVCRFFTTMWKPDH
jgi:hypothetical protein